MSLETVSVDCPYCGEMIEIDVEVYDDEQTFIEDCTVCCHPIAFSAVRGDDGLEVTASRSD
jgi:hypothetical protein